MVIKVDEVVKDFDSEIMIHGHTDLGPIIGVWRSFEMDPVVGETYDCELFLPYIDADEVTVITNASTPSSTTAGLDGRIHFRGLCETIEGTSVVVSFGDDWIECFELEGHSVAVYDTVCFSAAYRDIDIYPLEKL